MPTTRTKLVIRHAGNRDARLFIIATEGARTEPQYIDYLKLNGVIDKSRVIIEVVPTTDGESSPERVLERLKKAMNQYELKQFDEFWLLLDVDCWGDKKLSVVTSEAIQCGASLGISNPCFEVWIALHAVDTLPALTKCMDVEEIIRQAWGAYQKSNLSADRFSREVIETAIARATKLDLCPSARWPQAPSATHAYRLFSRLLTTN